MITGTDEEFPNPFEEAERRAVIYQHDRPPRMVIAPDNTVPPRYSEAEKQDIAEEVFYVGMQHEMRRSRNANPTPINSCHEGYSVILGELEKFWLEVKKRPAKRDRRPLREELIQCATMCVRVAVDLGLLEENEK